ncbi:MAG: universal stress protein, partial [Cyclobacteriaceae bacterium]|nr:universal stress protein [Cyclobacteriaceae bacterium]
MKKILIPTDFSEKADFALETGCKLAAKAGGSVILLHVIEEASHSTFSVTGELNFETAEERLYTGKLIERAREEIALRLNSGRFEGNDWQTEIHIGNPYHGIKNIIVEHKVDLVVMGTSGAHGFDELLVGSTTEKVVRYAKCPVLTVHKQQNNFNYKNIVLATGLRDEELVILDDVKYLQSIYGATIHLVRVNTPNNFERDRDTMAAMKAFAEKNGLTDYTANVFNDVTEEEGILFFSEHIKADLIAMATHGRTGFAHLLSGSIAEDV